MQDQAGPKAQSQEQEKLKETIQPVCIVCKEHNLTDKTQFNSCKRCGQTYCLHYASTIDPSYCTECLHDVTVTEETITKVQTHYNEEQDKLYTRTRKAKKISLGGMHWLFQARKIDSLTDSELELAIEYHKDILQQMLYERDERRVQHFARNRGKSLPVNFANSGSTISSETIEVKKTKVRTATKADPAAKLQQALQALINAGMTPEMIARMAKGTK